MANVAIIPARGGSKRIPRKNIKPFLGKPIIAYSIKAALDSGLFDEVMVSTDDKEIAEIAISFGAKVPFLRSAANADDFATTIDVIAEVIEDYKKEGKSFEYASCLYPSAPFNTAKRIQQFFDYLLKSGYDCVFPVLKYGYPIQRALRKNDKNKIEMLQKEHLITRSQDLEDTFHDAGQFYCFNVKALMKERKLWTNNTGAITIDEISAQDIDNLEDWEMAEFKYQYLTKKNLL